MAQGKRAVDAVAIEAPREARLRIQEVVLLVDVEALVVVAALVIVEFIVDAVSLVAHVTVLEVGEDVPLLREVPGSLEEHIAVELVGIRIIVFVVAVLQNLLLHHGVGGIGDVAEVVAVEVLQREASDDVPRLVLVVGVPHEAVGVLCEPLLSHEVRLLAEPQHPLRSLEHLRPLEHHCLAALHLRLRLLRGVPPQQQALEVRPQHEGR